jgi:hypothetical protein
LVVLALAWRAIRLPELPGSYPEDLDGLLYGGARLLRGELLHADFVTGQGATQTLVLDYTCAKDYCSAASRRGGAYGMTAVLSLLVSAAVGAVLFRSSS